MALHCEYSVYTHIIKIWWIKNNRYNKSLQFFILVTAEKCTMREVFLFN